MKSRVVCSLFSAISQIYLPPLYTWLFLVPSSRQVIDQEVSKDNTLDSNGSPRISLIAWWFRGYFCQDTLESALLLLQGRNYFAGSDRQVNTWSRRTLGQLVFEHKSWLLGQYFWVVIRAILLSRVQQHMDSFRWYSLANTIYWRQRMEQLPCVYLGC